MTPREASISAGLSRVMIMVLECWTGRIRQTMLIQTALSKRAQLFPARILTLVYEIQGDGRWEAGGLSSSCFMRLCVFCVQQLKVPELSSEGNTTPETQTVARPIVHTHWHCEKHRCLSREQLLWSRGHWQMGKNTQLSCKGSGRKVPDCFSRFPQRFQHPQNFSLCFFFQNSLVFVCVYVVGGGWVTTINPNTK